jgi:hypothetical protein
MRGMKIGVVGGMVLTLAACPDRPRDPAMDPATEPLPTVDPMVDRPAPAQPPAGAARAALESVGAATAAGEVHALARENSTEIWVTLRNAPPNESLGVRVHSGTCESPGPELARIDAIGTDGTGQGQSRTDVGHAPHLIMDGNHIVAVYSPGAQPERDRPMACATLPQQETTAGM